VALDRIAFGGHWRAMAATAPMSLSAAATRRLKAPRMRGTFALVDAARRQLALLAVADGVGQARIAWLVDPATQVIEDARFLAFGSLASHPVADAFTELARGRTVADACRLSEEQVESLLRDDPMTPAFGGDGAAPLAFLRDLQERALAESTRLVVPPRPTDAPRYERKRKADWSDEDARWLPLSLIKKSGLIEDEMRRVLRDRAERQDLAWTLRYINDDFRVVVEFRNLPEEQVPTLAKFLEDALRARVHAQIVVEPYDPALHEGKKP